MNRFLLIALFACSLAMGTLAMTGCNMMEGVGKDTKETGNFISGTPRPEAYHTYARDF